MRALREDRNRRRALVLAVDGGQELLVVVHPSLERPDLVHGHSAVGPDGVVDLEADPLLFLARARAHVDSRGGHAPT